MKESRGDEVGAPNVTVDVQVNISEGNRFLYSYYLAPVAKEGPTPTGGLVTTPVLRQGSSVLASGLWACYPY